MCAVRLHSLLRCLPTPPDLLCTALLYRSQLRYRWAWSKCVPLPVWGLSERPDWKAERIPKVLGGEQW